MLIAFTYFVIGFLSDFFVVKYYLSISQGKICAAVVCNSVIMVLNCMFIVLVVDGNYPMTAVYLVGQNVGIWAAIKLNRRKYGI